MKKILGLLLFIFLLISSAKSQYIIVVPENPIRNFNARATVSAIAFVQSKSVDSGNTTSGTLTFNSNIGSGHLNIVGIRQGGSSTVTVTDNLGNTYTQSKTTANGDHTDYIYYAKNTTAGACTVTVTFNSSATMRWAIAEYSGPSTSSPEDVKTDATGSSTTASSGNVTTSANDEVLIGFASVSGASTFTANNSFTVRETVNSKIALADRIVTSSGTYSASFTLGTSGDWICEIVTYKQ